MSGLKIEAILEGSLAIFLSGAWWWVMRQPRETAGWRYKASLAGLALPTFALVVQLILTGVEAPFGSLAALDEASLQRHLPPYVGGLWVCSFFSVGLLSVCGLALALAGKGGLRILGVLSSALVLGDFLINLVLAVNSFH